LLRKRILCSEFIIVDRFKSSKNVMKWRSVIWVRTKAHLHHAREWKGCVLIYRKSLSFESNFRCNNNCISSLIWNFQWY
jgi:hypothetical protein